MHEFIDAITKIRALCCKGSPFLTDECYSLIGNLEPQKDLFYDDHRLAYEYLQFIAKCHTEKRLLSDEEIDAWKDKLAHV